MLLIVIPIHGMQNRYMARNQSDNDTRDYWNIVSLVLECMTAIIAVVALEYALILSVPLNAP